MNSRAMGALAGQAARAYFDWLKKNPNRAPSTQYRFLKASIVEVLRPLEAAAYQRGAYQTRNAIAEAARDAQPRRTYGTFPFNNRTLAEVGRDGAGGGAA